MSQILINFRTILTSPNFYVPVILCLSLIVMGNVIPNIIHDNMKNTLFSFGGIDISLWSLSHVLLYVYFGYHFPQFFVEFLIIGAMWEGIESTFCKNSLQDVFGCAPDSDPSNIICKGLTYISDCAYWYGRFDDIAMNMIGFVVGALLSKQFKKTNELASEN